MEKFVEPKYYISNEVDEHTGEESWYIGREEEINGQIVALTDPELQDWDFTPMLRWCVENFKGEYKICMSDYKDFFIYVYDKDDAFSFKMRWE